MSAFLTAYYDKPWYIGITICLFFFLVNCVCFCQHYNHIFRVERRHLENRINLPV